MKKIIAGVLLVSTLVVSNITVFAAQPNYQNGRNNTVAYDEETAVENYIAAQEARKAYLEDMYSRGLITKERYDLSLAAIQADIDYVTENGLSAPDPYSGYGNGGYGYGCGGCNWGW